MLHTHSHSHTHTHVWLRWQTLTPAGDMEANGGILHDHPENNSCKQWNFPLSSYFGRLYNWLLSVFPPLSAFRINACKWDLLFPSSLSSPAAHCLPSAALAGKVLTANASGQRKFRAIRSLFFNAVLCAIRNGAIRMKVNSTSSAKPVL